MKNLVPVLFFLFSLVLMSQAQQGSTFSGTQNSKTELSSASPLYHLTKLDKPGSALAAPPFICPILKYYTPTASTVEYTENVPTDVWAIRLSPPLAAVAPCTVWTITVDFTIVAAQPYRKDTLWVYVRYATPPYTQIFSTYFLARVGRNVGEIEIDPPAAPPYNIRPIITSKRDVFVGVQIKGDSSQVKWKLKTPSGFTFPVRSVKYTSQTTFVPASSVVGFSVDKFMSARLCCHFPVPVELSQFGSAVEQNGIRLRWRTESETNNYSFEIQRGKSADGPWESRGSVAGGGTTTQPQEYEFFDTRAETASQTPAAQIVWYRLRQRDFDGTEHDTDPLRVYLSAGNGEDFRLLQGYPNPFLLSQSSWLNIPYQVPEQANVRITIHDALGREVTRLADHEHAAGTYETRWYPETGAGILQSGNYFIRLQSENRTTTRKISLVR